MLERVKEYLIEPMIKGIAAGIFPTLVILFGINETVLDTKFREKMLVKEASEQAGLLQEKVKIIENMEVLQKKYDQLLKANIRLVEIKQNQPNDSSEES